jgi:cellulose synthase/poly-beta-1,6-N-acetylglucosamine synthase-like glycosyltransferase
VAKFSFLLIFFYILVYGVFVTKGFKWEINIGYLGALLPIFLVDVIKSLVESFRKVDFIKGVETPSKITVIIPTNNGGDMLGDVLRELLKRYKTNQIIISSNGSTNNTIDICKEYKIIYIDTKEPIGKASAINIALDLVKTPYVLVIDDDTFIGDAIIPTSLLEQGYEAVAFRVFPKAGNWLTKIQTYEYHKSMDIGKCFQNRSGTVQNISGAIGLFKIEELKRQVNIHTNEFSGEDLQRTLLIHLNRKNKGVVITDGIVETDTPNTINSLYKQRISGWNPGMYSNIFNYLKIMFGSKIPPSLRYDAFYCLILVICGDSLRLITLPVLIFYPGFIPIYYTTYVALETILYRILKSNDPYWVVLIYPIYGIFNFFTRIIAASVFIYRRLAAIMGKCADWDGYKKVKIWKKLISILVTNILVFSCFAIIILSKDQGIYTEGKQYISRINQSTRLKQAIVVNKEMTTDGPYIIIAEKGDGVWNITSSAIDKYLAENNKDKIDARKNVMISRLVSQKSNVKVFPNDQFTFTKDEIAVVLALR